MRSMGRQRAELPTESDGWERRRNLLLSEYERAALELFAKRGFAEVTMDDVAAAVGVTPRTLFRYFGSKQDCLLGFPRRGLAAELDMIDALERSDDPVAAAVDGLREFVTMSPVEPDVVVLWNAATVTAPEVVDRVRGERIDAIYQAFVRYGERCFGVSHKRDPRPRLLAGLLAGIELTLVETVAQVPARLDDLLALVGDSVAGLEAVVRVVPTARTEQSRLRT